MAGKHSKYQVRREGDQYIIVFGASGKRVPGTATYESSADAKAVADKLP